jgi:hypothetical protein
MIHNFKKIQSLSITWPATHYFLFTVSKTLFTSGRDDPRKVHARFTTQSRHAPCCVVSVHPTHRNVAQLQILYVNRPHRPFRLHWRHTQFHRALAVVAMRERTVTEHVHKSCPGSFPWSQSLAPKFWLSWLGLKDCQKNIHSKQHARADRQQITYFALSAVRAQGVYKHEKSFRMSRFSCSILEMIAKWWYFFRVWGFVYLAYGFASLSHATTIACCGLVSHWKGSYV